MKFKFEAMKKMLSAVFVILMLVMISEVSKSQVVYFCNQPPVNGLPVDNASNFNFETTSGFLKVLINNQKPFDSNKLMMTVKELISDSFVTVKQNVFSVDNTLPWVAEDYQFDHDGDFRFTFSDGVKEIATGDVKVDVNEDYYPSDYGNDDFSDSYTDPTSTMYYIDSKVEASLPDEAGNFQYSNSTFLVNKGETLNLVFKVSNPKGLITDMLYVDVYSKKGKDSYGNFIETKEISMSDNPNEFSFNDTFNKKGEYTISVYTHDNVWINDCYISINYLH